MPYTSTIRQDVLIQHNFPIGAEVQYRGRWYVISQVRLRHGEPVYLMTNNKEFAVEPIDALAKLKPEPPAMDLWVVCYRTEDDGINLVPCHSEEIAEGQRKFAPDNYLRTFRMHTEGNWYWV